MGQLLVVVFFLALFIVAPIKAAAIFSGALLLSTLIVQATTTSISRVNVSLTDSFKAIVYSFFFTAVAGFKVALELTFIHSLVVAAASTLITTGAIWFISKMAIQPM